MSCDVGEATESLENEQSSQCYSHSRAHYPSFPSLHLRHSSFSNPSLALSTSQLILQPFRCFTYITAHSPTLILLLLCHRIFTYFTWRAAHVRGRSAHSPSFPSLHLRHNSFSNPSLALSTSQLILQPFRCLTYITAHSPTLPFLNLHHSLFSNHSFASSTSQDFHLRYLAGRPCPLVFIYLLV